MFEFSEQKKKSRELKNELKQWRKQVLAGGGDKAQISQLFKELEGALELGNTLHLEYEAAKEHLFAARERIEKLLAYMVESPVREVKDSLGALIGDLDLICHDCLIRSDDLDFQSTMNSLKTLAAAYGSGEQRMADIMLRSELENIKAVLDDAAGWNPPDFLALAYYNLKEDKLTLAEMENEQRNSCVISYFKEQFLAPFDCAAGGTERVNQIAQTYIYGQ